MNDTAATTPAPSVMPGRGLLIALGILNIVFGIIAMGSPMIAGTAVTIVIGILLLGSGIFELVHAFQTKGWKIGFGSFISGALAILGGGLVMARPVYGMVVLTWILAFYFVLDGVIRSVSAFQLKPAQGWGWILFGGLVTVLLGLMIWGGWRVSGLWGVGLLVGIRILMSGWTMLLLGLAAGSLAKQAEAMVAADAAATQAPAPDTPPEASE